MFFVFSMLQLDYNFNLIGDVRFYSAEPYTEVVNLVGDGFYTDVSSVSKHITDVSIKNNVLVVLSNIKVNTITAYVAGSKEKLENYLSPIYDINQNTEDITSTELDLSSFSRESKTRLHFIGNSLPTKLNIQIRSISKVIDLYSTFYSFYGKEEDVAKAVQELEAYINTEMNGEVELSKMSSGESIQTTSFNYTNSLSFVLVIFLLISYVLVFYETMRKSNRLISVMRQYGYAYPIIGYKLFGEMIIGNSLLVLTSLVIFNIVNGIGVDSFTIPFILQQFMVVIVAVALMILVAVLWILSLRYANLANKLKAKGSLTNTFYLFSVVQVLMFMTIVSPLSSYVKSFMVQTNNYIYTQNEKDRITHISMIYSQAWYERTNGGEVYDFVEAHKSLTRMPKIYALTYSPVPDYKANVDAVKNYVVNENYAIDFFTEEIKNSVFKTEHSVVLFPESNRKLIEKYKTEINCMSCEFVEVKKLPVIFDYARFYQDGIGLTKADVITIVKNSDLSNPNASINLFTIEEEAGSADYLSEVLDSLNLKQYFKIDSLGEQVKVLVEGYQLTIMRDVAVLLSYVLTIIVLMLLNMKLYIASRYEVLKNYRNHGYPFMVMARDYLIVNGILYSYLTLYFTIQFGFNVRIFTILIICMILQLFIYRLYFNKELMHREGDKND